MGSNIIGKNRETFPTQQRNPSLKGTYVNCRQDHGHDGSPDGFVLQEPGQLVDATVEEGISGHGVTALEGQRLAHDHVVVGAVRSAASDLEW